MANSVAFVVLVVCALLISEGYATERESKDPMAEAFQTLKDEEKTDFIAYFLALGLKDWAESQPRNPKLTFVKGALIKNLNISSENIGKFDKMNIPKDSRKKLLLWTKSEFNLTTKNVIELIRSKKCSGTTCLPDIGELCCPW